MKDEQSDPKRRETFKKWFPVISTTAAVFFLVLWLANSCDDKPKTPPDNGYAYRQEIAVRDKIINWQDSMIKSLRDLRHVENLKAKRDSTKLVKVATVNFNRYKQAVAEVRHLRDSFPQVNTLILAADSALAAKDSLYTQEVNHRIGLEKLYQIEVATLAEKNVHQQQISSILETKVLGLEDQNSKLAKRLERKKKGNRLLGGIALGLGAALGLIIATQ